MASRNDKERITRLEVMHEANATNFADLFLLMRPLATTVARHDVSIKWLTWGFRLCIAAVVTGIGGALFRVFASG